jgi:nucleotide-binding universal stress UspA family protein
MKAKRKILVALDGSEQSMRAVQYICGAIPPAQTEVVLLHVDTEIPESILDRKKEMAFNYQVLPIDLWATHKRQKLSEFMEKARDILIGSGFSDKAVTIVKKTRRQGIARDILKKSRQDFSALIVGRTGISRVKDIILGSVTSKLVEKAYHLPVVVVLGAPKPGKVLVAFDGSEGAMKGIDCVGSLLNVPGCQVGLCHVIRSLFDSITDDGPVFLPEYEREWVEASTREILPIFENAQKRLHKAGFPDKSVTQLTLIGRKSRAKAIIREAVKGGYNTVVVGRRGHSEVSEFDIGRVPRKILNLANNMAVWIV